MEPKVGQYRPKVGDIVFQTKNYIWSGPMIVVDTENGQPYTSCIHPVQGRGAFTNKDLVLIKQKTADKLSILYGWRRV